MSFAALLLADAANVFAGGEFGESAVYTKTRTGATRTINVLVDRQLPQVYQGVPAPLMIVRVPNSSTTGISSTEIDFGADKLTVALNLGETPRAFHIHKPDDGQPWQDAGMLRLELK